MRDIDRLVQKVQRAQEEYLDAVGSDRESAAWERWIDTQSDLDEALEGASVMRREWAEWA